MSGIDRDHRLRLVGLTLVAVALGCGRCSFDALPAEGSDGSLSDGAVADSRVVVDARATDALGSDGASGRDAMGSEGGRTCDESPCRPVVPQCGCSSGEYCRLSPTGVSECTAEPSLGLGAGELCSGLTSCRPGLVCARRSPSTASVCLELCYLDDDCTSGYCVRQLRDVNGDLLSIGTCTIACDPLTLDDPACPADLECVLDEDELAARWVPDCRGPLGGRTDGVSCPDSYACAQRHLCVSGVCREICDSAAPMCPFGLACNTVPELMVGDTAYGFCR